MDRGGPRDRGWVGQLALMLVSLRLWSPLPKWLLLNDRFSPRDAAEFGRALGIRITGAVGVVGLLLITLGVLNHVLF